MCLALLGEKISKISLYDIREINSSIINEDPRIEIAGSWKEAYIDSDVFITCTVSDGAYIDSMPKAGSLHLNVSLRDYTTEVYEWFKDAIIVDDWVEVCREKTDIENMHLKCGLVKSNTHSIIDLVKNDCIAQYHPSQPIMFNPMGMAIFDIAIANFYYEQALLRRA
jgi:ornithine cyclodeaminase